MYFDSFQNLAVYINKIQIKLSNSSINSRIITFRNCIAGVAFISSLFILFHIILRQVSTTTPLIVLAGVISSGSAFYFGRWINPLGRSNNKASNAPLSPTSPPSSISSIPDQ